MITIIDYKLGNLGSLYNMLKKIGVTAQITSDISDVEKADKLILPGVGSFNNGMRRLSDYGFIDILHEKVIVRKAPILGICLGIQLFTKKSEEGNVPGLGWIDAETVRFTFDPGRSDLKIPHMGWNLVEIRKGNGIFKDLYHDSRFYFVHSYHLQCEHEQDIASMTSHGYAFVSSIEKGNIYGVQFHPEKSHKYGMRVLRNFAELPC